MNLGGNVLGMRVGTQNSMQKTSKHLPSFGCESHWVEAKLKSHRNAMRLQSWECNGGSLPV